MELLRPRTWDEAQMDPRDVHTVWVVQLPCPDVGDDYAVALVASPDESTDEAVTASSVLLGYLRGYQPMRYASAVLAAAAQARHEQMVWAQLTTVLNLDAEAAAPILAHTRRNRPSIRDSDTAPMTFAPILGMSDMRGRINVSLHGVHIGQWDIDACVEHAQAVVTGHHMAQLDTSYYQRMRDERLVGLDEMQARLVVSGLSELPEGATGITVIAGRDETAAES